MKPYIYHLIFLILWIGVIFVYPHQTIVDGTHDRDPAIYIAQMQQVGQDMSQILNDHLIALTIQSIPPVLVTPNIQEPTKSPIYTGAISQSIQEPKVKQIVKQIVEPKQKTNLVSKVDYDILTYISKNNMTGLSLYLPTVSESTSFSTILNKRYAQYAKGRDLPASYRPGLVALAAYEQGYTAQALALSYTIIQADPGYILPHQIIAYISIADKSYRQAKKSLLILIALDITNSDMYRLLLGKVSYMMGDYTDTIIYLKQLPDGYQTAERDLYIAKANALLVK